MQIHDVNRNWLTSRYQYIDELSMFPRLPTFDTQAHERTHCKKSYSNLIPVMSHCLNSFSVNFNFAPRCVSHEIFIRSVYSSSSIWMKLWQMPTTWLTFKEPSVLVLQRSEFIRDLRESQNADWQMILLRRAPTITRWNLNNVTSHIYNSLIIVLYIYRSMMRFLRKRSLRNIYLN